MNERDLNEKASDKDDVLGCGVSCHASGRVGGAVADVAGHSGDCSFSVGSSAI